MLEEKTQRQPGRGGGQAPRRASSTTSGRVRRCEQGRAGLALALAGLRWRLAAAGCRAAPDGPGRRRPGTKPPPDAAPGAPGRPARSVLYSETPGSFVDLVAGARDGVVAIRASTPGQVRPGGDVPGRGRRPPATSRSAPGFLIDHQGTFVLTNDHIAAAAPELTVVLPRRQRGRRRRWSAATSGSTSRCSRSMSRALSRWRSATRTTSRSASGWSSSATRSATRSPPRPASCRRPGAGRRLARRRPGMGFRTFIQTDAQSTAATPAAR